MGKSKQKASHRKPLFFFLVGTIIFALIVAYFLKDKNIALLHPKGWIASEQLRLMLTATALMLVIGIPALTMLYFTAWKYRESNDKAVYDPHIKHGKAFVPMLWAIPLITAISIATMLWPATHQLEPRKTISNGIEPLKIQVIALRWKWLFIYPEQNIATVNYVQLPVGTPIQFDLTADETPMSSFWIPNLGGQLYAMTGHNNRLNLVADTEGEYPGSTAEINGNGFAGMRFVAHATSMSDFATWAAKTKESNGSLDIAAYEKLLEPSKNSPVEFFAGVAPNLYDEVLLKYADGHGHNSETTAEAEHLEHE